MEKIDKITRIKLSIFVIYLLTFFTPIYSQVLFGIKYKVSISELNAWIFFVIFFLFLIIGTVVSKFILKNYYRIIYLITLGFMALLLLILLLFKEETSTLRLTWYLHLVLIIILVIAHFKAKLLIKTFDLIVIKSKDYCIKVINFVNEKNNKMKDKKKVSKVEDVPEEVLVEEEKKWKKWY